jgi:ADP-ribosyl-[dinitrogen reductase] hydrolase
MTREDVRRRLDAALQEPVSPASRRLACLLGGALGDAVGYRVEFKRWPEIERAHGPDGIRLAACKGALVVSDDTQMTLFTLEGMARAKRVEDIVTEVREAYLDWLHTQGYGSERPLRGDLAKVTALKHLRAPGTTCLSALRRGGRGTVKSATNDSKGCGGVMRAAPLGFLPDSVSDTDVFLLGAECAALTHGHPDGFLPAGAMAVLARDALRDVPSEQSIAKVLELTRAWPKSQGTAQAIESAVKVAADGEASRARVDALGEGWVGEEALAVGLYAAMVAKTFSECIELAANHDGDSDSTASIAGQLWGARFGLGGIAREVVERVDVVEALVEAWGEWERALGGATR